MGQTSRSSRFYNDDDDHAFNDTFFNQPLNFNNFAFHDDHGIRPGYDDHEGKHDHCDNRIAIVANHWVLTDGHTTTSITGNSVTLGGKTYLLVDQFHGGYQTVAQAVTAATGGETILIAPGTYNESTPWYGSAQVGLYINKPNLTLQGVDAHGCPIMDGKQAQAEGPTIVAAHQGDPSGASFFIDVGGTNTTLEGLHLKAGFESSNKLLEFWADNVTIKGNFIDEKMPDGNPTGQAAIYINEITGSGGTPINSYTIDDNVLNSGIYVANGVGTPGAGISNTQTIIDNDFIGIYTGLFADSYDMVAVQGEIPGIGWQNDAAQVPTIMDNTRDDDTSPFIFRMTEKNLAYFPTADEIAHIAESNTGPDNSYAYLLTSAGELRTYTQDNGDGPFHRYYVANSIDTLNLGVDSTPDDIYTGKRIDMQPGDKLMVQSGDGVVHSNIVADGLTVIASEHSEHLNLTLADTLPDGTPVTVQSIMLGDYSAGHGANVNVTGNALDNVIIGNSGNNTLSGGVGADILIGGAGNDILVGGAGADTLIGGAGKDTFKYVAVSDSRPGAGQYDTILDFAHSADKIDLSAIDANTNLSGDQAFDFVSAQTNSVQANKVTWHQDIANNVTIILADSTGDAAADVEIHLAGLKNLTGSNFIL